MASAALPLNGPRWAALTARDRAFDGRFVYAVTTTGVYCRPSCGARTPKRAHVRLFADPAAAEAAGFRACQRCHPDRDQTPAEARVADACALIDEHLAADPDARLLLAELAAAIGWSPGHLQRTFSQLVGLSPRAYADARRLERAKAALRDGETVLAATFEGGFGSGKALYERADDAFGMTPGSFRRGGARHCIRYALFDTALGVVLVAATEQGVCAVALGDAAAPLLASLAADFPAAERVRDDDAVGPWAEPILRLLAGAPGASLTDTARRLQALPLDVRGTSFQRQVWTALQQIPFGETRSYGDVAALLGRPEAARAVARACGANRIAIVVPCHRVIGAGGALRGYRWGIDRKRRLLQLEAQVRAPGLAFPEDAKTAE